MQGSIGKSVELHHGVGKKTLMNSKKCPNPKDNHKISSKSQKSAQSKSEKAEPYKLPKVFLQRLQDKALNETDPTLNNRRKKNISTTMLKSHTKPRPNLKLLRREHEFVLSEDNIFSDSEDEEYFEDTYHIAESIPIFDSRTMSDFDKFAAGVHAIEKKPLYFPNLQKDLLSLCKEGQVGIQETGCIPQGFIIDVTRLVPESCTLETSMCDICRCLSKIDSPVSLALVQLVLTEPTNGSVDVQLSVQWSMRGLNTKATKMQEWIFAYPGHGSFTDFIKAFALQIHSLKPYEICWPNCMSYMGRKSEIKRPLNDPSPLDYSEDMGPLPNSFTDESFTKIPDILNQPISNWPFDQIDESIELPCANCLQEIQPNSSFQLKSCKHVVCQLCWIEQVEEYLDEISLATDYQLFKEISLKCPIQDCPCVGDVGFILQFIEIFLIRPFLKARDFLVNFGNDFTEGANFLTCQMKYCSHVIVTEGTDPIAYIKCSCAGDNNIICCKYSQSLFTPWPFCQKTGLENSQHVFHWPLDCNHELEEEDSIGLNKVSEVRKKLVRDKKIKKTVRQFSLECEKFSQKDLYTILNQFLLLAQSAYQSSTLNKCNSQFLTMQGNKILSEIEDFINFLAAPIENNKNIYTRFREKQTFILSIVKQIQCITNRD